MCEKYRTLSIWLVDPAPRVIASLNDATRNLAEFMTSQDLTNTPEDVANLKGDAARSQFVNLFKEVQRLKTQLDQYTDLTEEQTAQIDQIVPADQLQGFRGVYLETAKRLREKQDKHDGTTTPEVEQLDFEFVLFASALIDYDYIISLIARMTQQKPGKRTMNRDQLIGLIAADAKFLDEREEITAYIRSLPVGEALNEDAIRAGYARFKAEQQNNALIGIAQKHGLAADAVQAFVEVILRRRIFDGEALSDLMAPLGLGWKVRTKKELEFMDDLAPLLHKLAQGQEISGLNAYEQ